MEENKNSKISILTFFLILSIIVIIVMAFFLYKLNKENKIELEKIDNLNNEVSNLENTANNLNENITNVSSIKYIEMTEENYEKYSAEPYSYRIQEMIDNKNGTITIKGRVYIYDEKDSESIDQEIGIYNGTYIYMEIKLDEDLECKWGKSITTLRDEYDSRKSNGTLVVKDEDNIKAILLNDEFVFENGECTSIIFSNV